MHQALRARTPAALVGVIVLLAGCSGGAKATSSADQPSTIHVIEHPEDVSYVRAGCGAARCLGDYYVGHSSMSDATTGETVGTFVFECFVVDDVSGLFHCPTSTLDLTGRGQIVYTESVYIGNEDPPAPAGPWPIIGGTGEFLGASGTVASPEDSTASSGDFVITITK
jgi:hypothetical protein